MRALIPPGVVELSGASAAAQRFAAWFGDLDGLEAVDSGGEYVGDRLHLHYRLRVKRPGEPWRIVQQHLFCAREGGRLTSLDLICSGFRPDRGRTGRPRAESASDD
jgi:hypothetical protein